MDVEFYELLNTATTHYFIIVENPDYRKEPLQVLKEAIGL